jgi:hypothetical protein
LAGLIGALRVTLSADTAKFSQGMARARRDAVASGTVIQKSMASIKASVVGMMAGMTVGAFAGMAKEALDFAGAMTETARSAGLTVEQVQILTRAAIANGIGQDQMMAAMARLNAKLGEAKAGSAEAIKAFKQLGISEEQLRSFDRAGDVLPLVMEGIKNLKDESLQAAAAKMFFSRAFAGLMPFLSQGADGYNQVAKAAREAGLITQEQAEQADAASDRIDVLAYSLKTNLTSALLGVLPVIESVIQGFSRMIRAASAAINWLDSIGTTQSEPGLGMQFVSHVAKQNPFMAGLLATVFGPGKEVARPKTPPPPDLDLDPANLDLSKGGGRRRGGGEGGRDDAERKRKEALRNDFEIVADQRRADIDILRAKQDMATEHQERADLDRQILGLERDQELSALQLKVSLGDLTEAQAAILRAKYEELDGLKHLAITQETDQRKREELAELQDADADIKRELLEGQADLAKTQAERRRIELAILELAYEEERRAQQRIVDDPNASAAQQQAALARLAGMGARKANDNASIVRDTMGPLEAYLESLPKSADEVNEALQGIATEGLQSLSDGIVDAIMGAKSLGDVFKAVAKQIIADLIRIAVQRAIIEPLANALFSSIGGSGSGGGFGSGSGSSGIPGFAKGGAMMLGGMAGVDRNLLSLNGQPLARVSRGERIKIDPQNDNGPSALRVQVEASPDLRVTMATTAGAVVAQAAPGIAARARGEMLRDLTRRRLP